MRLEEFDYRLPRERIAQHPPARRDAGRMLVVDRDGPGLDDSHVARLAEWLSPGDLLVLNDTRVVPARLVGAKSSGGRVELLLIERVATHDDPQVETWRCWVRASRKPAAGSILELAPDLVAEVLERQSAAGWLVRLRARAAPIAAVLERVGQMPLPPYIERPDPGAAGSQATAAQDRERYQTVFARHPGAVAAPTAGLHFTRELLDELAGAGVATTWLTLHVGPGTFEPVRSDRVEEHVMHPERFEIPPAAAAAVEGARNRGGRVVAVGTTVVRTLEHRAARDGTVLPGRGQTDLFITPGFRFGVVDALLTNFHLPRSTLLMLVAAFAGRERVLAAYDHAVRDGYRFYSYGDAMLVRSSR